MANMAEIREELIRYLAHQQTLDDFNEWLIANTWDVPPGDSSGVRNLFGVVERIFAEHLAGHISAQRLQQQLVSLVSNYEVLVDAGAPTRQTSATSSASKQEFLLEAA